MSLKIKNVGKVESILEGKIYNEMESLIEQRDELLTKIKRYADDGYNMRFISDLSANLDVVLAKIEFLKDMKRDLKEHVEIIEDEW